MSRTKTIAQPDFVFETSWEVCNRVGGIYTVLSTRARTMQNIMKDHVFFFGPDLGEQSNLYFREDRHLLSRWKHSDGIRVGRWRIPGQPIAILVNYQHLWERKDAIYAWAYHAAGVKSHAAYGDYDDSALFGSAVGEAMQSLFEYLRTTERRSAIRCVAQMHEWQTAFALFYLRAFCPAIRTIFTTHATSIGRSIAGNGKALYSYFKGYHGEQMAEELNMVSKHSAEREAARLCNCFTTVSRVTARECEQLLDKAPDIVTPNGFEPDFVPAAEEYDAHRLKARRTLLRVAQRLLARPLNEESTMFVGISGRLEWRNKGIDVFLDAIRQLNQEWQDSRVVVAVVMVPYLDKPSYSLSDHVHVIFLPWYLDGKDEIVRLSYYDLLIGFDATVFPSYYEPWGYTPMESAAFSIPTITTSLSGFGQWVTGLKRKYEGTLRDGVLVLERDDDNYGELVSHIATALRTYLTADASVQHDACRNASAIASRTLWKHFIKYYQKAYAIALK